MADARKTWEGNRFWATAYNNYLDIAVLEWCKVFAERNGMHHWTKSVSEVVAFKESLLGTLRSDDLSYTEYVLSLKAYRDKFVAHLDEESDIQVPRVTIARLSTQALYGWLRTNEDDCNAFGDAPLRPEDYYYVCLADARKTLRGEA